MKRVRQADTTEGLVNAFIEAAKGLPAVPKHVKLRQQDMPYWEAITAMKPRDEWNEVELVAAAQLARAQADIAALNEKLENEPMIVAGPRNTPRPNPAAYMLEAVTRRQLALMRALGLVSVQTNEANSARNRLLKNAREVRARAEKDPLLAS